MKFHPKDSPEFALRRSLKKGRKGAKAASTPEATIQAQTEAYLDALGLPYVRIPAFVLRAAFAYRPGAHGAELGAMRQAAEYLRGLPDLLVLDGKGHALPLELKTDAKASKLNAAQRLWRTAIGTIEARSFEEAKAAIDEWRHQAEGPTKSEQ